MASYYQGIMTATSATFSAMKTVVDQTAIAPKGKGRRIMAKKKSAPSSSVPASARKGINKKPSECNTDCPPPTGIAARKMGSMKKGMSK